MLNAAFVFAGFVLVFLVLAFTFPRPVAIGLLVVSVILTVIAAIGAYVAHYHPDQKSAQAAPKHNVVCARTERRRVYLRADGGMSSFPVAENDIGRDAVIAVYANKAVKGEQLGAVRNVRATLSPVSNTVQIPSGLWLDEADATTDLEPGAAVRELVLVYREDDASIYAPEDRRDGAIRNLAPRHIEIFKAPHLMGALSVGVQLTSRGHVVNDCRFFVDIGSAEEFDAEITHQEQFQFDSDVAIEIPPDPWQDTTKKMAAARRRSVTSKE